MSKISQKNDRRSMPASISRRFAAYLVDGLICTSIYGLMLAVFLLTLWPIMLHLLHVLPENSPIFKPTGIIASVLINPATLAWIYFSIFERPNISASLGKRLVNLKLEGIDGKPAASCWVFIRNILHTLLIFIIVEAVWDLTKKAKPNLIRDGILLLLSIGWYCLALITKYNRCLHDLLTKTRVMYHPLNEANNIRLCSKFLKIITSGAAKAIMTVLILFGCIWSLVYYKVGYKPYIGAKFNKEVWHKAKEDPYSDTRCRMCNDLMKKYLKKETTEKEVVELLGEELSRFYCMNKKVKCYTYSLGSCCSWGMFKVDDYLQICFNDKQQIIDVGKDGLEEKICNNKGILCFKNKPCKCFRDADDDTDLWKEDRHNCKFAVDRW